MKGETSRVMLIKKRKTSPESFGFYVIGHSAEESGALTALIASLLSEQCRFCCKEGGTDISRVCITQPLQNMHAHAYLSLLGGRKVVSYEIH
jgi:hypothetical protein